ncbi:recombinase family protein [Edaphobacter aggregans]|uniref:recombinase family protein n=1 Tax=Edaphobacter aggregans TaxID=570835 RepID=UPI00054F31D1|nr:recombinase family protein [Edaphobacter aggregans]
MSKTAFAYLRVSGKGQIDGDGFPRQLEAVTRYAAAHNLKVVKVYREEGVSGTKGMEERPAFNQMVAELQANGTRIVLIESVNRLARELMVQETLIGVLRRGGFELVSVAEPDLCSDDPSRVMVRQLFGVVSQYEKSTLVAKLRGARRRAKAKTGRCEGRKPYGDRPGESEVIARAKSLRVSGLSWDMVAQQLNAAGMATRYGGQWFGSTISKIVGRNDL